MICISPLTSLMMDQHQKYKSRGLTSELVGEAQTDRMVTQRVLEGEVQLVFITPENIIKKGKFRDMLLSPSYVSKLVAVVVDEAHCVKTWGDDFRVAFSNIGDLRSVFPPNVGVHALTATATTETYHIVCKRLSMEDVALIALPPFRDNISYEVHPKIDAESLTQLIACELKEKRTSFPKTIVYVRTYNDCSTLYLMLKSKLGGDFTEPPGCLNITGHRLVDMFTRVLTPEKKEEVIHSFALTGGTLRIIIATTAFGMGIDCPDIRKVIHWGIPSCLEEYVQETGRSGRDGLPSQAVLYEGKGGKLASKKMKSYVSNKTVCRRRLLFQEFLLYREASIKVHGVNCCDICGE